MDSGLAAVISFASVLSACLKIRYQNWNCISKITKFSIIGYTTIIILMAYPSMLWLAYFDEYFDNMDWYGRHSSAEALDDVLFFVSVDEFDSKPILIFPDSSLNKEDKKALWQLTIKSL